MQTTSRSRRGRRSLLTAGIAVIVATGIGGWSRAGADEVGRSYNAVAQASGVQLQYGIPKFLVVERFIDGGGPVSQAVLGSDGNAESFASLPYPGPIAVGFPGIAALVLGIEPPVAYPFYATAKHPTNPEQKVADPSGGYSLVAKATGDTATGDARMAPPPGNGEKPVMDSRSEIVAGGGRIVATAMSVAQAISVGPLSLGVVRSKSVTTYETGLDKPTTSTELSIEGGRAGDTSFSFGADGLQVAQRGVPIPAGDGLAAVNQALAPFGLSIGFGEATPVEGGAAAKTFEIMSVADVPGAGRGTLTIRFGGAVSFINLGPDSSSPSPSESMDDTSAAPPTNSVRPGSDMLDAPGDSAAAPVMASVVVAPAAAPAPDLDLDLSLPMAHSNGADPSASESRHTTASRSITGQSFGIDGTTLPGSRAPESAGTPLAALPASGSSALPVDGGMEGLVGALLVGGMVGIALIGGWRITRRSSRWTP